MKKEFLIERNGRLFCLYAGLLDAAHEQGLKSIVTHLVQVPTDENKRVAIVQATIVLERNGVERVFTGIGDAAPNNVAPAMQTCLLRMAETRAKARALRDAVNIGVAAYEELGEDQPDAPREYAGSSRTVRRPSPRPEGLAGAPSQSRLPSPRGRGAGGEVKLCPACHAPEGKPHLRTCTAATAALQPA